MIEHVNQIAELWWAWMWPMLWQVAILVALVWIVDLLIRRRVWPQVRYALWLLVLVKLVLPPTLSAPTSLTSNIQPMALEAVNRQLSPAPTPIPVALSEEPALVKLPTIAPPTETLTQPAQLPQTVALLGPSLSTKSYLMSAWLLGAAVLALLLTIRLTRLRKSHSNAAKPPQWFDEQLDRAAKTLRLRHKPKVILSQDLATPAVFGAISPVLLIPADNINKLSRKEIQHVLLHELAHIKRGDLIVHGLYMMLQVIYWFNPLLWLVRRQLQHLRELCCDATVAAILQEQTSSYRETIIETARRILTKPVGPGMGLLGLFEDSSRLSARLKWLEKKTWKHSRLRITIVILIVAIMTACILPMAKSASGSPTLVIKGCVTDAQTGLPVTGAKVYDDGYGSGPNWDSIKPNERSESGAITNSSGEYSFLTWPEHHSIKVTAPGYKAKRDSVHDNLTTLTISGQVINFSLEPVVLQEQPPYRVTLANGVEVELVGVCEHPSQGKQWWRPDGSALPKKPYGSIGGDRTFGDSDEQAYEFVVRLTGATEVDTRWRVIPKTGGYGTSYPSGNDGKPSPDLRVLHTAFPKKTRTSTIRFGVAAGPWETVTDTPAEKSFGAHGTQRGGVIFSDVSKSPYGTNPSVFSITVTDDILDLPCRIIAITHDGQQIKPIRTSGGSAGNARQTTAHFEAPPIDKGGKTENSFKEFQFQTRQYEWVTFKNISLQPGVETDVQVSIRDASRSRTSRNRNRRTRGRSTKRKKPDWGPEQAKENSETILFDDFDDYANGTDLSSSKHGGWIGRWGGNIKVINDPQIASSPCVKMDNALGCWTSQLYHPLPYHKLLWFSADIKAEPTGRTGCHQTDVDIVLSNPDVGQWGRQIFSIGIASQRTEWHDGPGLVATTGVYKKGEHRRLYNFVAIEQDYQSLTGRWINVTVRVDSTNHQADIWIDNIHRATALLDPSQPLYKQISLNCSNGIGYVDNVHVFVTKPGTGDITNLLPGITPRPKRSRATRKRLTPASTRSSIKAQKEKIKKQLATLNNHRERLIRDMRNAEESLQDVRERFNISDLDEHSYPHSITQRLIRLEKQRDDCGLEIAQQKAKLSILDKRKEDLRDVRINLGMLNKKLEQLQQMVEEAKREQDDLDMAKWLYKQRLDVRDERKRTLDSIKAKIEKMRLEYDGIGLSPSPPKPAPARKKPVTRARSTTKRPVPRGPSRTTITD